jgi:probable rRNA maturation factor
MNISQILKENKKVSITVTLVSNEEIKKLNKKYLDRDYETDVLSFSIKDKTESGFYLGDIVVSAEKAEEQRKSYNNSLEHEIAELVEHGVLHLLGIHHEDDDEITIHSIDSTKEIIESHE